MKRLFAIVMLCVHLFTIGGYTLLFQYYIHKSDVQMVKEIFDNKIDNAKLIEIKIPVNMPTVQDWTEYEVIQGQIQLKDAYYNYVRLKMTHDTMYFVCIPNTVKTHLVKANIITANQINDVPLTKKGHDASFKKVNTLSDYNLQAFKYHYQEFETQLKPNDKSVSFKLNSPFIDSPGKPPNSIS
ncbi:hypothetical protein [Mucilaginibacter sp. OK098]|uniref:hypothetical protein n=1 Tax=Mucilaginibacter sp. OK098 TaxID=1855297 RepID=UPI00091ED8B5|nr:hypothetical protein [Mucilaginibacter sp. OK098]SHL94497.1 hypothetical protein SAMN05216524_101267 [Mucilaginibacter sp. OK098]